MRRFKVVVVYASGEKRVLGKYRRFEDARDHVQVIALGSQFTALGPVVAAYVWNRGDRTNTTYTRVWPGILKP